MKDNEVIAKFMEHPWIKTFATHEGKNGEDFPYHMLKYHTSWDWLMKVVEKIEALDYGVAIKQFSTTIGNMMHIKEPYMNTVDQSELPMFKDNAKINHTYYAVIQFINWYNNQLTAL